ncbi:MAG TPA: GlmU family protein [Chitinophagaceae bacterium]|nr:GlmU family protein [Chitinophagaceae bacterium]
MNHTLFDSPVRRQLLPFTHTRPVADIRCGILTMRERWELLLQQSTSSLCPDYMQAVYAAPKEGAVTAIDGSVFATAALVQAIAHLQEGEKLEADGCLLAAKFPADSRVSFGNMAEKAAALQTVPFSEKTDRLQRTWDIFMKNEQAIKADFTLLTTGRTSQPLPSFVTAINPENIFIEVGAVVGPCIINASKGPVYIGADAEIMEGCLLRGPIAMGAHSVLKMGAKVYGATTIGEGCKVGGEVSNTVFFANSNKGHDGFLGNAVIGEWCNLGADTNCSNLKNNYDIVKVWDEDQQKLVSTGLQFCGLMMGDHSKCGINTMFNTGTVVGVSANVFGSSFPEKFIPSFSWGAAGDTAVYAFDKAMETAGRMMERRGKQLNAAEQGLYRHLFNNRA